MINKKNLLGKTPETLGVKDAIHTAIVSVRAACRIEPGATCDINKDGEAVPSSKGCGIADPWLKEINTGDNLWLILNQDEVPNVQHVWEHPKHTFAPPTREIKYNSYLKGAADSLGVTYQQLMAAAEQVVDKDKSTLYPGTLNFYEKDEDGDYILDFDTVLEESFDKYDFWSYWSDETGYVFENTGSACCPEHEYPDTPLFYWSPTKK